MDGLSGFKWPHGAKGAVSLTYDDGLISQVDNALPVLNIYGLKGTFFPSGSALMDRGNAPKWEQVAASGHEIGSHTLNHPCDCSWDFVKKGFALQDYSMQRMREELQTNLKIINGFGYVPEKYVFAYPCGESSLGASREHSYVPLIKEMFSAARGVTAEYADPRTVDIYNAPCFGVECDGDGLIEIAKQAADSGRWAIFLFHGVGRDYISVTTEAHRQLATYLAENQNTIWTAPFGKAAKYVISNRTI